MFGSRYFPAQKFAARRPRCKKSERTSTCVPGASPPSRTTSIFAAIDDDFGPRNRIRFASRQAETRTRSRCSATLRHGKTGECRSLPSRHRSDFCWSHAVSSESKASSRFHPGSRRRSLDQRNSPAPDEDVDLPPRRHRCCSRPALSRRSQAVRLLRRRQPDWPRFRKGGGSDSSYC